MKNLLIALLLLFSISVLSAKANQSYRSDTLRFTLSAGVYSDITDYYDELALIYGVGFGVERSWYGVSLEYCQYNSLTQPYGYFSDEPPYNQRFISLQSFHAGRFLLTATPLRNSRLWLRIGVGAILGQEENIRSMGTDLIYNSELEVVGVNKHYQLEREYLGGFAADIELNVRIYHQLGFYTLFRFDNSAVVYPRAGCGLRVSF